MSIQVKNVVKQFGKQRALDNVSFEIENGQVLGLLGPNGAGKTTMMRILAGVIPADSGRVIVYGTDVMEDSLSVRRKIGYLPENNPLYTDMYVKEHLGFAARLYNIRNVKQRVEQLIEMTGLRKEQHKKIGALSKGFRQRVGIAQALVNDPDVLILDEPTGGLDPNQVVDIRNLISDAGREKIVILSTHIMQEVEAICDRIIIISSGAVVTDDSREKILEASEIKIQTVYVELDREISSDVFREIPGVISVVNVKNNHWTIQSESKDDIRSEIFNIAVKKGLTVLSMQKKEKTLENIFRELTG